MPQGKDTKALTHSPTAVIWDFNGTILNDVELAAEAVSHLLRKRNLPPVDAAAHREMFMFPIWDYYRKLGFDLDAERHGDLADEFHHNYRAGFATCSLNDGICELLEFFRWTGVTQFILSAAEETMLHGWLRSLGIHTYFRAAYGLTDLLAGGKADRGRTLVRDYDLDPSTTLFIGDTDHDVHVARTIGCRPIVVLQGHQTRERIGDVECDVYDTFADLRAALVLT